jgi:hypothetical protein
MIHRTVESHFRADLLPKSVEKQTVIASSAATKQSDCHGALRVPRPDKRLKIKGRWPYTDRVAAGGLHLTGSSDPERSLSYFQTSASL